MNNEALQGVCLAALFLLAAAGAVAPMFLKRSGGRWLSRGSCFGGGVIITVGIVHLLQDSNEAWEEYFAPQGSGGDEPLGLRYPVAGAVAVAGCLLMMYIEELATFVADRRRPGLLAHDQKQASSHSYGSVSPRSDSAWTRPAEVPLDHGTESEGAGHFSLRATDPGVVANGADVQTVHLVDAEDAPYDERAGGGVEADEHGHGHAAHVLASGGITAMVMLFALSFHSVIEGIAIGIQDTVSGTLGLFAAVASHKAFAAFALGVELQRHVTRLSQIALLILLFSVMTPIGIGVGMGVGAKDSSGATLAKAIIQSIATGTFLFIGFVEVLPNEFASRHDRFPKLFAVTLGALIVCGTQIIDKD